MRKLLPGVLALLAAIALSIWAYPQLPAEVATHFDAHGRPNGWSPALAALGVVPVVIALLLGLFTFLPRIDPRRESYAQHQAVYWTIANAILCFMALVHWLIVGKALGWTIDVIRLAALGVGALFLVIGALMPRMQPNWFMGIRTPWTLSSDTVWRETHRVGGLAFIVAGVVIGLTGTAGGEAFVVGVMAGVAIAAVVPIVYSLVRWRAEQRGR